MIGCCQWLKKKKRRKKKSTYQRSILFGIEPSPASSVTAGMLTWEVRYSSDKTMVIFTAAAPPHKKKKKKRERERGKDGEGLSG